MNEALSLIKTNTQSSVMVCIVQSAMILTVVTKRFRTGEKQAGGKQRDREEGEGKGGTMTTKLLHSRYMIIFATVCQHACMI